MLLQFARAAGAVLWVLSGGCWLSTYSQQFGPYGIRSGHCGLDEFAHFAGQGSRLSLHLELRDGIGGGFGCRTGGSVFIDLVAHLLRLVRDLELWDETFGVASSA